MSATSAPVSPQRYARVAGIAYLVIIVAGLSGEMAVRGSLVVPRDAAATAANISASEWLWRAGIAGDLLMHLCDVVVMGMLYVLLSPVHRPLARLAVLFNLTQTGVLVANKLTLVLPLLLLGRSPHLEAFTMAQRQALAYVSIRAHDYGFGFGLLFFGVFCLLVGYLTMRSGYLPRWLGALMQLAGACYVINSTALVLSPALASRLFPAILLPPFVGELAFALWLLVKGVDTDRWTVRAPAGAH
jgi:hypothetical protein